MLLANQAVCGLDPFDLVEYIQSYLMCGGAKSRTFGIKVGLKTRRAVIQVRVRDPVNYSPVRVAGGRGPTVDRSIGSNPS